MRDDRLKQVQVLLHDNRYGKPIFTSRGTTAKTGGQTARRVPLK
jgi:hypothetical protein